MEYEEIRKRYETARDGFRKFRDRIDRDWDWTGNNWDDYRRTVWDSREHVELEKWSVMERCTRKVYGLRNPEPDEIPVMTGDFLSMCRDGRVDDSSGRGFFGTRSLVTDIDVYPSVMLKADEMDVIPRNFTHIWWKGKSKSE